MNKLEITKLITVLDTSYFKKDWIIAFPFTTDAEKSASKGFILDVLTKVASEIINYYVLLLLSGEYLNQELKGVSLSTKNLEEDLTTKASMFDVIGDINIREEINDFFLTNLIGLVKYQIAPKLDYLERNLEETLLFNETTKTFRIHDDSPKDLSSTLIIDHHKEFLSILELVNLEHFEYVLDDNAIQKIITAIHTCRSKSTPITIGSEIFYSKDIVAKANFLLAKILKRAKFCETDYKKISIILDRGEEINLDGDTADTNFKDWDETINYHYNPKNKYNVLSFERRQHLHSLIKTDNVQLFEDFHALMRQYDIENNIDNVDSLYGKFQLSSINPRSIDKYAYDVASSYFYNSSIILKLNKCNFDPKTIEQIITDLEQFQANVRIKNHFPWLQICMALSTELDKLIDELLDIDKLSNFKIIFNFFTKALDEFEKSFKWCKVRKFVNFQLPFEECKSSYKIETAHYGDLKLFCFSSFVLPLNYSSVAVDLEKYAKKRRKYENLEATYEKLKKVLIEVKKASLEAKEISNKFVSHDKKSIEILGIFSAVALFSIGSIQIMDKAANQPDLFFKIILSFGYCLALFVFLIWIISRDSSQRLLKFHWIVFGFIFIVTTILLGIVTNSQLLINLYKFFTE